MINNKITIKRDKVVDIQRGAIGHRATWTGLTYTKAMGYDFHLGDTIANVCCTCQITFSKKSK